MTKIYIFSGLGVDRRVFNNFLFKDIDVTFIDWTLPLKKENIIDYTKRIAKNIQHEFPILIGLSFGGIVAIEVAKIINVKQVIILASVKTKYELPSYYRVAGRLQLNKVLPSFILKKHNCITNWFFGANTKEEKELLEAILDDTSTIFLKWAINETLNWKNTSRLENIVHIHGNSDCILPFRYVKADYCIKQGGHFMTVDKASEIEEIILEIINS